MILENLGMKEVFYLLEVIPFPTDCRGSIGKIQMKILSLRYERFFVIGSNYYITIDIFEHILDISVCIVGYMDNRTGQL